MHEIILKAEEISKNFGGTKALSDVNFELLKGEVHALIGQNGAGKSTFSRIIAGDLQNNFGRIYINGVERKIRNPIDARKLGISMIYQELRLIPYLTVAENIFLNQYSKNKAGIISWKKILKKSSELMEKWDIKLNPNSFVNELSIAQQQLVEILKSLSIDAKILIMDEPTSSLGHYEVNTLFKLIEYLKNSGVAIIYISHILEEIFKITDKITIFRDGRNCGTFITKDISPEKAVEIMLNEGRKDSSKDKITRIINENKILEIKNLKRRKALNGVNLELKNGEILGITGLIGSGKTELANCIFGLDKIDSGEIIFENKKIRNKTPAEAIKFNIGLIPEDRRKNGIFSILSIRENITFLMLKFLKNSGIISTLKQNKLAKEYSGKLNIKYDNLNQALNQLSGGNQQKVVIGRWLTINPKILIADEPTRGIDVGTKKEIYQLIKKIANTGTSVIVFSEEIEEILELSDRILVMSKGKIIKEYENKNVSKHDLILCVTGLKGNG
ncbi:MAG: sugar ABC transporter ATP-binding protein, partial [Candidatus Humimicrobiaceae bacterium]